MPYVNVEGPARSRLLQAEDFARIAAGGFGDVRNNRAQSMAWYRGRLYVGVTRHADRVPDPAQPPRGDRLARRGGPEVGSLASYKGQHGQIWRYDPASAR
jgi:hypothetical protein